MKSRNHSIVQFWDQKRPPAEILRRMDSWKRHNPQFRHRVFDRIDAAILINKYLGSDQANAFLDIRIPAMMADVFRVAHLMLSGGLWIDAASTCLGPIDQSKLNPNCVCLLRKSGMIAPKVWNGWIYSYNANQPFLSATWEQIEHTILTRRGENIWVDVGPGLFSRLLASNLYTQTVLIHPEAEVTNWLKTGSSSEILPAEQHWLQRQRREALYRSKVTRGEV